MNNDLLDKSKLPDYKYKNHLLLIGTPNFLVPEKCYILLRQENKTL